MNRRRMWFGTVSAAIVVLGLSAPAPAGSEQTSSSLPSSCFWVGPYLEDNPGFNVAFLDMGAAYWSTDMRMPAGSHIVVKGRFAHARYESLIAYNISTTTATDGRTDRQIEPDPGSRNPFVAGERRIGNHRRSFTLTITNELPPADGAKRIPNTLYAGVSGAARQALVLRIYVPDRWRDLTGGVGLPEPELHLVDGRVLTGQEMCAALGVTNTILPIPFLTPTQYSTLRDKPGTPRGFPALNPPVFRTFYNGALRTKCNYSLNPQVDCYPTTPPTRSVALYPTPDNQYMYALGSRAFGEVLVLRGRLPSTPETRNRNPRMGDGQLRYWSICQYEGLLTQKVESCLYDEQIPLDERREYVIVTSRISDRPHNAIKFCGVAFLPWPENGDGAGHLDDSTLIVRNMAPAPNFHQAIQDTRIPGDEDDVLGPYLPRGEYMSTAEFEKLGCDPTRALIGMRWWSGPADGSA